MKTAVIRRRFLDFFVAKGHTVVTSSPLVPVNDPTLMFTNSGMVQFKDVFLGFDKRPYQTAVTAQRCLRAGGKHNDLENVGYTARHHTFFEMLGNFSFGDYFKEKAIPYAWEFLTSPDYLGIDKAHLWVTVFGGGDLFGDGAPVAADDEAAGIWLQVLMDAGFSCAEAERRIIRISTTDNFWMMGDTGPCGPCSEIFYDKDAVATAFRGCDEAHADDCVEIWNLVFMQYNREGGELSRLPKPCVDTGMGLERISAVMQGVESNYDIDLFTELLAAVTALADTPADGAPRQSPSHRVIADHIRAAVFLLADGVMPSNDGRGYVLRRIIRRALRHVHKIGGGQRFHTLVAPLARIMGEAYPLLNSAQEHVTAQLKQEETGFSDMLNNGMAVLQNAINRLPSGTKILPGETVFKLYDTYGFPPDMTNSIARDEYQLAIDEAGFERCMEVQRTRSRAATKFNVSQKTIMYDGGASEFTGYSSCSGEAEVLALFIDDAPVAEVPPGHEALIVLDKTPFYAESGGQIGDTGTLSANGLTVAVCDTQKIRSDVWGHIVRVEEGCLKVGAAVDCQVDATRRREITRAHSAAHLMHAALRQVLGKHVEQRGSQVSPDSVRFDFSHNGAVTPAELREVEQMVNQQIAANAAVQTEIMAFDDALKTGAMALFGEKYGDRVRVVTIDPAFSVELCGGTHVGRAGDIGFFHFTGETAIAAGIRRVEALTTAAAVRRAQSQLARLGEIAALLKSPIDQLEEKIAQLREQLRAAERRVEQLQQAQQAQLLVTLAAQAEAKQNLRILVQHVEEADAAALRYLARQLQEQLAPAAVFLSGEAGGKALFAAAVSADTGVSARDWIANAAAAADAKGGGKADFAQAGGGDPKKHTQALAAAREFIG